eukprot:6852441-Ditylum_brightwellii.AAC.1
MLFLHNLIGDSVPCIPTRGIVDVLIAIESSEREDKCDELLIRGAGHQDTVLHLMFGRETRDATVDWMQLSSSFSSSK